LRFREIHDAFKYPKCQDLLVKVEWKKLPSLDALVLKGYDKITKGDASHAII
jgi:hypothetical protein